VYPTIRNDPNAVHEPLFAYGRERPPQPMREAQVPPRDGAPGSTLGPFPDTSPWAFGSNRHRRRRKPLSAQEDRGGVLFGPHIKIAAGNRIARDY